MKEVILLFLIILIIPRVLSGENESEVGKGINLSYPLNVNVGEEFEISVEFIDFEEDVYDIKFEILNGTYNIAQRYWDNKWKSTNYWISEAINSSESNESNFRLKISENYNGSNEIKIKIRDSSKIIKEYSGYFINAISNLNEEDEVSSKVYFKLKWNEDNIVNKGDFKIKIRAFNLKDKKYDVKLWIENNNKIISERYDYTEEKWKSGNYYLNNFFKGPGNKTKKIKIRIKESEDDLVGYSNLFFKTRDGFEIKRRINIINKKIKKISKDKIEVLEIEINNSFKKVAANIIKLGSKEKVNDYSDREQEDLKKESYIIYESKTEKIKKYAVYFFAFLCVLLSILMVWKKLE